MESVVVAVGSNVGDRRSYIQRAGEYLASLTENTIIKSSVWESEPVGAAKFDFLNCAAKIETSLPPEQLLLHLKEFEQKCGREAKPVRWGPRIIDLDLIGFGDLVIQQEGLIIPHPEYKKRLFVLLPLQEIDSDWCDPENNKSIEKLINEAPKMDIKKTGHIW